ncbi:MAG: hypothetical protein GF334_08130 [Candidatus Altiarchaeales archaeon]|nr:hypothetical protein [Candidatus Altiarchaeales archaeon]
MEISYGGVVNGVYTIWLRIFLRINRGGYRRESLGGGRVSDGDIHKVDLPAGTNYLRATSRDSIAESMATASLASPGRPLGRPLGQPVDVALRILKSAKKVIAFLSRGSSTRVSVERDVLVGLLKDLIGVIDMACTQEIKLESGMKMSRYILAFQLNDYEIMRLSSGGENMGVLNSLVEEQIHRELPSLLADSAVLSQTVDASTHQHRYIMSLFLGQKIDP